MKHYYCAKLVQNYCYGENVPPAVPNTLWWHALYLRDIEMASADKRSTFRQSTVRENQNELYTREDYDNAMKLALCLDDADVALADLDQKTLSIIKLRSAICSGNMKKIATVLAFYAVTGLSKEVDFLFMAAAKKGSYKVFLILLTQLYAKNCFSTKPIQGEIAQSNFSPAEKNRLVEVVNIFAMAHRHRQAWVQFDVELLLGVIFRRTEYLADYLLVLKMQAGFPAGFAAIFDSIFKLLSLLDMNEKSAILIKVAAAGIEADYVNYETLVSLLKTCQISSADANAIDSEVMNVLGRAKHFEKFRDYLLHYLIHNKGNVVQVQQNIQLANLTQNEKNQLFAIVDILQLSSGASAAVNVMDLGKACEQIIRGETFAAVFSALTKNKGSSAQSTLLCSELFKFILLTRKVAVLSEAIAYCLAEKICELDALVDILKSHQLSANDKQLIAPVLINTIASLAQGVTGKFSSDTNQFLQELTNIRDSKKPSTLIIAPNLTISEFLNFEEIIDFAIKKAVTETSPDAGYRNVAILVERDQLKQVRRINPSSFFGCGLNIPLAWTDSHHATTHAEDSAIQNLIKSKPFFMKRNILKELILISMRVRLSKTGTEGRIVPGGEVCNKCKLMLSKVPDKIVGVKRIVEVIEIGPGLIEGQPFSINRMTMDEFRARPGRDTLGSRSRRGSVNDDEDSGSEHSEAFHSAASSRCPSPAIFGR